MLRKLAALVAALAGWGAAAQGPPMNVSASGREPLVWQGDCVRTRSPRDVRSDPCPTVGNYIGKSRNEIDALNKNAGETDRRVQYWKWPVPPEGEDKVEDQWPRPGDFGETGWHRRYPVFVLFGRTPPPPNLAPDVERQPLLSILDELRRSEWKPNVQRADRSSVDLGRLTAEEKGARILIQRPRPQEAASDATLDLFIAAQAPAPPPPNPTVPRLVGQPAKDADGIAGKFGFTAREFKVIPGKDGLVVFQSPPAGLRAPADTPIEYIVARDRAPPVVTVPNVVGCEVPVAVKRLRGKTGIDFVALRYDLKRHYVMAQNPGPGDAARESVAVSFMVVPESGLSEPVRATIGAARNEKDCPLPPPEVTLCPKCPGCEVCRTADDGPRNPEQRSILPLAGAAGAGALGAYALTRLLIRRRSRADDEEEEATPKAEKKPLLRTRVHPDNRGVQVVEQQ